MDPALAYTLIALLAASMLVGAWWGFKRLGGSNMDLDKDGVKFGEEMKQLGQKVGKRFNKQEKAELRRMLFKFLVKVVGMLIAQKIDWKTLGQDAIAFGQKVVEHADED
jgi:uncharacterized membrane protein AbrB (regulator of aidB expression)